MTPSITRRRLLGTLGAVAVGLGASTRVPVGPIDAWEPDPETWPHERYGPANTAANPHASVPSDPVVRWNVDVLGNAPVETTLVVGQDAVFAGGERLAVLGREGGERRWFRDVPATTLAAHDGTLYATAAPDENAPGRIRAYPLDDSTERWSSDPRGGASHVVVADGTVFAGHPSELSAYDAASGDHRWTDSDVGETVAPLVHDGSLYAADDRIRRYRQRTMYDIVGGFEPGTLWKPTVYGDFMDLPTAAGGQLVVGSRVTADGQSDRPTERGLSAHDLQSGERVWGAFRSTEVDVPDGDEAVVSSPAVLEGRGFVGVDLGYGSDEHRHEVAAVSMTDGGVEWRQQVNHWIRDVAAATDAVVVATGAWPGVELDEDGLPRGEMRAFDPKDGAELWRAEFEHGVHSVAVVDGAVFATRMDGHVVALR